MKDARESAVVKDLTRKQAARRRAGFAEVAFRGLASWFPLSAGAVLLWAGANTLLDILGADQAYDLQDPLFGLPWRQVLLGLGLGELFAAWLVLWTNKKMLAFSFIAWFSSTFIMYRIGLWSMGWHHPWVFFASLANAWGVSPVVADTVIVVIAVYLFAGSAVMILGPQEKKKAPSQAEAFFKVHCSNCGGKTAFTAEWAGRTTPCPHCGSPLALRSENVS